MALTRKKITVRGKNGKTFQRSVMVRAGEAVKRTAGKVGRFVNKHKGKIAAVAGAAALAGGLAYAHKKGHINLGGMASRVASAVRAAPAAAKARHAEGMAKARTGVKAASHPDREAQGKSRGRVAQAVAAVKGYARGVGATGAVRGAANSARDAASRGAANAGAVANNVRVAATNVARKARSSVANYKAGRTRKRTTLQLGSGS